MTMGRKIFEVQEIDPYEYGELHEWVSVKFFSEEDCAELFAERYGDIHPEKDLRIVPRTLLPLCPEVEVWYEAKAYRDAGGHVHFRKDLKKLAYWDDEVISREKCVGHYVNQRGEAVGVGQTPEEARKQVAIVVEEWNREQDEKILAERKAALGNFLGMAGPMITEGL